jgi:hypothetical protein
MIEDTKLARRDKKGGGVRKSRLTTPGQVVRLHAPMDSLTTKTWPSAIRSLRFRTSIRPTELLASSAN